VLTAGLGGGIGTGKTLVADLLVARGALLIDADVVAREVREPGGAAYGDIIERFGAEIVAADGTIDRAALAAIVFADKEALGALNSITHPKILSEMLRQRDELLGSLHIVVFALPLLVAHHRETYGLDVTVVVDAPVEVAIDRLVNQRGMSKSDAEARIAAQLSREQRRALGDYIIENASTTEALEIEVDRLWAWLVLRAGEPAQPG
jgi:dephospho-CoA kinase